MELIYFSRPEALNNFILAASPAGSEFLQSWTWGEILRADGEEILRVGVMDNGRLEAVATLAKKRLGAGYFYWYSPRGPLGKKAALDFLFRALRKMSRRALFWRLEPMTVMTPLADAGPLLKTLAIQPAQTLILDLKRSEEELLAAMHPKTRYNIRLAEKKGVSIVKGRAADFGEFWRLLKLTKDRDRFRLHGPAHYQHLLTAGRDFVRLFFARYQGRNVAAVLSFAFGDKVTYAHGASDYSFRSLMAPYLLHWEIIRQAQREAYKYYDFYGLNEKQWPGVTRFKLGFGGGRVFYPGTFDLVWRKGFYRAYNFLRRRRRLF